MFILNNKVKSLFFLVVALFVAILFVSCNNGSVPKPDTTDVSKPDTIAKILDGRVFRASPNIDEDIYIIVKESGRFIMIITADGFPVQGSVGDWSYTDNGTDYDVTFSFEKESSNLLDWVASTEPAKLYYLDYDGTTMDLTDSEDHLSFVECFDHSKLYGAWWAVEPDDSSYNFKTVFSVYSADGEVFDFKGNICINTWEEPESPYSDRSTTIIRPSSKDGCDWELNFNITETWNFTTNEYESTSNTWTDNFSYAADGTLEYYIGLETTIYIFNKGVKPVSLAAKSLSVGGMSKKATSVKLRSKKKDSSRL